MSIGLAEELPLAVIPTEPLWSENFYFVGHDPNSGVSIVVHMGRWSKDPQLWREQVLVFLPDGTYALAHNIGRREADDGPRGAMLDLICQEPGQNWLLRYHGPARPTSAAELLEGAGLRDRPRVLMDVDLTFEATQAIWDFGDALKGESWVQFHYEQPGRFRGSVVVDGTRHSLSGVAHRDHSRGPRTYQGLQHGAWLQGHFANGLSFAVLETLFEGKPGKRLARVFQGGETFDATCSAVPIITQANAVPVHFDLIIKSAVGEMIVTGTMSRGLAKTFDARNEPTYGTPIFPGITAMIALVGPVRWDWDGQEGFGHADLVWGPEHNPGDGG